MSHRVIIVTGAAGNLGRAVVARLIGAGFSVAAVDRGPVEIAAMGLTSGADRVLALGGKDLTAAADCDAILKETTSHFGRIDGVAATVGGFAMAGATESEPSLWERMFAMNVITTSNIFRAAIPELKAAGAGCLVAVGAAAAVKAPAGMAAYAGTKAAVMRMVESFADELKGVDIRVNAVLPSTIDTPQIRAALPDADPRLWVTPEQIASVIHFLISDAASGVTGALIPVTGRG